MQRCHKGVELLCGNSACNSEHGTQCMGDLQLYITGQIVKFPAIGQANNPACSCHEKFHISCISIGCNLL